MSRETESGTLGIDLRDVGGYKTGTMLPSVLRARFEALSHVRGILCKWAGQRRCPAHSLYGPVDAVAPDMRGWAHG